MKFDEIKTKKNRRDVTELSIILPGPWDLQNNEFLMVLWLNNHVSPPPGPSKVHQVFCWVAETEFHSPRAAGEAKILLRRSFLDVFSGVFSGYEKKFLILY